MLEQSLTVASGQAGRLDRIVRQLTGLSLSQTAGLIDHGCVRVDGAACAEAATPVRAGAVVSVRFDPHSRYRPKPKAWSDPAFEIAFEDQHLIVVNKAAGVLTVPANPGDKGTLAERVSLYLAQRGHREPAQVVHRLDQGVSGLLVFGKSRPVCELLQAQFEARKPEREYAAIVRGVVPAKGTFKSYLATTKNLQRYSTPREADGELAITHYQLKNVSHRCSVVRVWLETGRRNQIRVHFAEAGHPVLGDPRYAPELAAHPRWRVKRLALHAAVLGFTHPVFGKALRFEAPLPGAMKGFAG